MTCYVSQKSLSLFLVHLYFPQKTKDFIALDIFTPQGSFSSSFPSVRIANAYSRPLGNSPRWVSLMMTFPELDFPYLVVADFNIHNSAADPCRVLSSIEEKVSVPYFSLASDLHFTLLYTPGIYTRFPCTGSNGPSTIDLAFANPPMFPAFLS